MIQVPTCCYLGRSQTFLTTNTTTKTNLMFPFFLIKINLIPKSKYIKLTSWLEKKIFLVNNLKPKNK